MSSTLFLLIQERKSIEGRTQTAEAVMQYCENCGAEVASNALVCPSCGLPTKSTVALQASRRTAGSAKASLVLGIAGLLVCPLVCSALAIIFGSQAKRKIASDPSLEGGGLAMAGIVLGWTGIAIVVVIVAFLL